MHVVRVCKHMRVKYFSHCNPPLPATQCDMFSQFSCVIRSRRHADCIYIYNILFTQPRRRPLHSQLRAHPRSFCSSRLYFSSCSFFFFCIFYSALNISRAKCAIHKCSCRMSIYVHGYFIGQTRSACAIFIIYHCHRAIIHSRNSHNCSLSSVTKLTRLPDHVVLVRKPRPREGSTLDVAEL